MEEAGEPLEIRPSTVGAPTLFARSEYLDDAEDPARAAASFATADQVKDARLVVVFGGGLGYRVQHLRALGARRVLVYEPCRGALAAARQRDPEIYAGVDVVEDIPPFRTVLIQHTEAEDTVLLLTPPAYKRAFASELAAVVAVMREAQLLQIVRHNTLMDRSAPILEAAARNFRLLAELPVATALGEPLKGTPAFIVAAGPSLDRNAHLLTEARERGVLFAVNTSAPAVVAAGAGIDVLACIEAIDQTRTLEPAAKETRVLALELAASPANYGVHVDRRLMFLSTHPAFAPVARALGVAPLAFGGSVATAAFALAKAWGADPIVLVGQDLGYPGGKAYARGTGREHFRAVEVPGGGLLVEDGGFFQSEYSKTGITAHHKARPMLRVPAWGGVGTVPTTHDLLLFARWFESAAYEFKKDRQLVNATEGGMSIAGFAERPLAEVLAPLPPRSRRFEEAMAGASPLDRGRVETVRASMIRASRELADAARACRAAKSASARARTHQKLREAGARAQLAQAYAAPILKRLMADRDLAAEERARRTYLAVEEAGQRIADLLDG